MINPDVYEERRKAARNAAVGSKHAAMNGVTERSIEIEPGLKSDWFEEDEMRCESGLLSI